MNTGAPNDPGLQGPANFSDRFVRYDSPALSSLLEEKIAGTALSDFLARLRDALYSLDTPWQNTPGGEARLEDDLPGARSLEELHASLHRLQSEFMDRLYAALAEAGINISHKITLRMDDKARLFLCAPHPDEAALSALLKERTDLAPAFAEIALCSALLRDLRGLQLCACYDSAADAGAALLRLSPRNGYQLSLKGDMNHFYFSR